MRMSLAGAKYVRPMLSNSCSVRMAAPAGASRRRARQCNLLCRRGWLRAAVPDPGPAARKGPVPRRRSMADGVVRYFEDVFKIPIRRGRAFTDRDDGLAPPVVIINEAMAKRIGGWRSAELIDPDRRRGDEELNAERERQIVGVASDVRDGGLNNEPGPHRTPNAQVLDALNALNDASRPSPGSCGRRASPTPAARRSRSSCGRRADPGL